MTTPNASNSGISLDHDRFASANHFADSLRTDQLKTTHSRVRGEAVSVQQLGILHVMAYWECDKNYSFVVEAVRGWLLVCPATCRLVPPGIGASSPLAWLLTLESSALSLIEEEIVLFLPDLSRRIEARILREVEDREENRGSR